MRNLCIGKCVEFRIERTTSEGKSYGPVTIQGKDAALPAVSVGWAKVSILLFLELEDQGVFQASKLSPKSMSAAYMNWGIRGIVEVAEFKSSSGVLFSGSIECRSNAPFVTPDVDPIALEAKCFTERLVLHRYGYAKYVEWSGALLDFTDDREIKKEIQML
ncbi:hypothetical protein FF1_015496 [Malus domestica]